MTRAPVHKPHMLRLGLILAGVVFVADQISKWVILGPMRFSPPGCLEAGINCRFIELTPFFDLQMVWNRGVSFGLLRADQDLFAEQAETHAAQLTDFISQTRLSAAEMGDHAVKGGEALQGLIAAAAQQSARGCAPHSPRRAIARQ